MNKTLAQLTIAINASAGSWLATAIESDAKTTPLIRADQGYISGYHELEFNEQISFLRHRLAGVLQLGCDRMWAKQLKPCHMTFLVDKPFANKDQLTQAVADHFVEWMTKPTVTFYVYGDLFSSEASTSLKRIAGDELAEERAKLDDAFANMQSAFSDDDWEVAPLRTK